MSAESAQAVADNLAKQLNLTELEVVEKALLVYEALQRHAEASEVSVLKDGTVFILDLHTGNLHRHPGYKT